MVSYSTCEVAIVRILVASRRPCDSEALATSSYGMYLVPQPRSAEILVSAAVRVVFPWSTWPMVPTFTCGFFRSNFAFAMARVPVEMWVPLSASRPQLFCFVMIPSAMLFGTSS